MPHDFEIDEVLEKPLMAHLASASTDGPRESPLWFLWEDGLVWLIGRSEDSFVTRLQAEPRCAIGIVDFDVQRGVLRHIGIRGSAEVQQMSRPRLERLLRRYLGAEVSSWNSWFLTNIVQPLDVMICIHPRAQLRMITLISERDMLSSQLRRSRQSVRKSNVGADPTLMALHPMADCVHRHDKALPDGRQRIFNSDGFRADDRPGDQTARFEITQVSCQHSLRDIPQPASQVPMTVRSLLEEIDNPDRPLADKERRDRFATASTSGDHWGHLSRNLCNQSHYMRARVQAGNTDVPD